MKKIFLLLSVICFMGSMSSVVSAADPVDLRGKKGVPENLKKYDPPPRSLHIKEPPSPTIEKREPPEKSHGTHRDRGPERPTADVKVPGPGFKPPTGLPVPGR
jgi:cell division protein FtsN